jgi:hypothetical protein
VDVNEEYDNEEYDNEEYDNDGQKGRPRFSFK